jgi:hypothetical protein
MEIKELREAIHRIYEEMPDEQPDIPDSLIEAREHGTYIKPPEEEWQFCRKVWMEQLEQAKHWIDATYRNVVAKKPQTNNDRLVISNCKYLLKSFMDAKENGFMELGWVDYFDEK